MAMSKRERNLGFLVIAALLAVVLEQFALGPYLDRRNDLIQSREAKTKVLSDARATLREERRLRRKLAGMDDAFRAQPSGAEGQVLRLVQETEQQSGVNGGSFQRSNTIDEHGFTRLTFQVTAIGHMPAIALMLHRLETASLPLRLDETQIHPKQENGDELQLHLTLSTLCREHARPEHPKPAPDVTIATGAEGTP